ncbi:MAG TPA: GYD domain-containing protein [Terriglobia bacterium]|nr:GYD domain-containing protein [Terriglobia bacterium]
MAEFLLQVAYTSEAWATLVKNPQDRIGVVSKALEKLGGRVVGGWLCFGDYDTVLISEMPDHVSAAAFAMAIAAGGACKSVKTTPLLSTEEGMEAMKKAGTTGYVPPKAGRSKR